MILAALFLYPRNTLITEKIFRIFRFPPRATMQTLISSFRFFFCLDALLFCLVFIKQTKFCLLKHHEINRSWFWWLIWNILQSVPIWIKSVWDRKYVDRKVGGSEEIWAILSSYDEVEPFPGFSIEVPWRTHPFPAFYSMCDLLPHPLIPMGTFYSTCYIKFC